MSTQDNLERQNGTAKIVRLKVDGAKSTVNTLWDQQTQRGVSLICPFPALEVNLPATFTGDPGGEMQKGTIHRIGVEDDPETGLPRLRLSIRSDDCRSTMIKRPPVELIDESSRQTVAEVPKAPQVPAQMAPQTAPPIPAQMAPSISETMYIPSFDLSCEDEDPQWVNCDELPLPEAFMARTQTRRRYNLVRKAVYTTLIVALVGAGIAVERTGIIKMDDVRSYVAGLTINSRSKATQVPVIEKAAAVPDISEIATVEDTTSAPTVPETTPPPAAAENTPVPEPAAQPEPMNEQAPEMAMAAMTLDEETTASAPTADGPVDNVAQIDPSLEQSDAMDSLANEINILLPTRWPVEYASGYRIKDPAGVVIDVPGGLVKREGWLPEAASHPLIRSIKSIQRETGARFIVYVNGDLPRFMTSPKTEGVSLRLYDLASDAITTQQVAMAD